MTEKEIALAKKRWQVHLFLLTIVTVICIAKAEDGRNNAEAALKTSSYADVC